MKIIELNTYCGAGSTGRIALGLAQAVQADGGTCKIVYGAGDATPASAPYAVRIGNAFERKLHGALRKLLDAEGYGSWHATRDLISLIKRERPDVIHIHNLHGCYVNLRMLFAYLAKADIPVVWTLHDCWAFTGHCAYFDYARCERWKTQCANCPQKLGYPACVGWSGAARNYRHKRKCFTSVPRLQLVTPCDWLRDLLKDSYLRNIPARTIYNGVDRTVFHPTSAEMSVGDGKIVLAVASDWDERKGLRFLPELAERLGAGYQVVALGLNDMQIASLPPTVQGLPRTGSPAELAAWYTAASCLANPTMEDNMPLVNLEALACGTPVVVFDTGGCSECVNESCGAVVPKGNVVAMSEQVKILCTRHEALRENCIQRAIEFDAKTCTEAYLSLYREVMK